MQIKKIHSYLTHPAKALDEKPQIRGATVSSESKLYVMLEEVFEKSGNDCNIDISFDSEDGRQENPSRTLIISYAEKPTIGNGRAVAEALQAVTTNRSGMGLLFLVAATDKSRSRILVSRFPADVGILAEESGSGLNVEFVEKVFMKKANAYKSVLYDDESFETGFWDGRATDKQITDNDVSISDYWIRDFLRSDFRTTPQAGTRRLAVAMRNAVKSTGDVAVKSQISSAAQLVKGLPSKNTSISSICSRFNFSDETRAAIYKELPNKDLAKEQFVFSSNEFEKHVHYRAVELDNGGQLVAEAGRFDEIFLVSPSTNDGAVVIRTEGRIVDERLRKSK